MLFFWFKSKGKDKSDSSSILEDIAALWGLANINNIKQPTTRLIVLDDFLIENIIGITTAIDAKLIKVFEPPKYNE